MDFVPGEPESLADAPGAGAAGGTSAADADGAAGGGDAAASDGAGASTSDTDAPIVVLRSLTKLHAIPGLRAGYLLAPAPLARRLRALRPGWSVNALALAAARAVAQHPEHAREIATRTARDRADLVTRLRDAGLTTHAGHANFVLAEHPDGPALLARLRQHHGISLRPCHSFPGLSANHLRIAVRTATDHARLAHAIADPSGSPRP
jgi:histidinol-phosphate/aromatic aminotransferase/cobyric acid decarboxylase-like protein